MGFLGKYEAMGQGKENPRFLRPKDWLVWGGYVAGAIGTIAALSHIGTVDALQDTLDSAKHVVEDGVDSLSSASHLARGVGFLVGLGENAAGMVVTLGMLNGKIRLQGTGNPEFAADGVLVYDQTCVDGDIAESQQDIVEAGSGLMQGTQLINMLVATGIDQLGDGPVVDFLVGRMMGRALPAALISTVIHAYRSITAWGRPAERVIERPHEEMCGWTATASWINLGLKFTHQPSVILDTINKPARAAQVAANAIEQAVLMPASVGKSIRLPGKKSPINRGKHKH